MERLCIVVVVTLGIPALSAALDRRVNNIIKARNPPSIWIIFFFI